MADNRKKNLSPIKNGTNSSKSGNGSRISSSKNGSQRASHKEPVKARSEMGSRAAKRTDTPTRDTKSAVSEKRKKTAANGFFEALFTPSKKSSGNEKSGTSGKKTAANSSQSHIRIAGKSNNNGGIRSNGSITVQKGGAAVKTAPKKKLEAFMGFDYPFFTIVMILLAFGIIMMFSASYATAYTEWGDSLYYLKRQAVFAVAGIGIMLVASVMDYHVFRTKIVMPVLVIGSVALMGAVKIMGTSQGGSERWIEIAGITFQPSEILKFAVIVLFAYFAEKNYAHIREFKKGFMPLAAALIISCGLLMLQPHLSGTIIVFLIGFAMMYVSGVRIKHLVILGVSAIALVVIGLAALKSMGYDYFSTRLLSFQDPEADIGDKTFQTYQSLVTIGSGGMFGLGFGNSRQKYSYLPMARNDFIFSIICEELGFVGAMLVILLFVILVWRGFYICSRARDKFGMMLAFGITFQIGLQALLNIAVVSNSVPNTGISLPFFSYGGTALLMQLGEMGVLLNISRKAELE